MPMQRSTSRPAAALLLAGLLLGGPPARAQDPMMLVLRGQDTIAVEKFRRTATRFDLELVDRMSRLRVSTALRLTPSGLVPGLEAQARRADAPADSPPLQTAVLAMAGDSVIIDITGQDGTTRTQRLGTRPGAIPYYNPSFALLEIAVLRLNQAGTDSLAAPLFLMSGGQTLPGTIRRNGPDSVVYRFAPGLESRLAVDRESRITGGSVPAQGLTIARGVASSAALFVPPPDYSAPPGAPYRAEEVTVPTPMGHTLAGTLTIPGGKGPFPAMVTITGSGSQERDEEIPLVKGYRPFRQIADTLSRMGIAVLRMDDRGAGKSGGGAGTATSEDFARDIEAGVAYLRGRKDIDGRRIGLIGHSEGGLIAPMVATRDPGIRALVLMAGPAQTGRQILEFQNRFAIEHAPSIRPEARDSALAAARVSVDSAAARNAWIRFFLDHDPLVTARKVTIPVLILQGATDQQVTADQAEVLASAIRSGGNNGVTVKVFPGTNHLFLEDPSGNPTGYISLTTNRIRPEVIAELTRWVARVMR